MIPEPRLSRAAQMQERWATLPGNLRGGILYLAGALLLTIMLGLIKLVRQRLHVTEILFFRQLTMAAISAPMIVRGLPDSLRSKRPDLQLLRIAVAFGAMTLGFTAVIHLPLAEATTLGFTKTFFMTILGILLLGEAVRTRRWVALAVGFGGVRVILWPSGQGGLDIYHLASLASACLVALVMVLIRKLSQVDQPLTILSYQAIGVGLLMVAPTLWFWQTPTWTEAGLLVLIGAIGVVGQYINILALKAGEAGALAPLDFTRLVFAGALGLVLFGEWPANRVWLGAAVIVAAALYILHRELRLEAVEAEKG